MNTTPFEHSPLDTDDPKAIQILELLPSRNLKGPICCELRHTSLDENVQYEALSYVWGEPEPGHTVFVNGSHTLDVTRNCLEALTCLRRRFHSRSLWVDAICIDQREDDRSKRERDRQVKIMGDVFHKAKKVLVWFGPAEPTTGRTMTRLKCIAKLDAAAGLGCFGSSALGAVAGYLSKRMVEKGTMGSALRPRYHAFASMTRSPWWRRVWTLQEQYLAKRCEAYHGRQRISFLSLRPPGMIKTICHLSEARSCNIVWMRHFILFINKTNDTPEDGSSNTWLDKGDKDFFAGYLLEMAFDLDTRHPTDKIYGLHSLLTTACNLPLPAPDYKKTAEVVYEETVRAWINTRADLSILKLAGRPEPVHGLPSWVPAWHQQHPRSIHNIESPDSPEMRSRTFITTIHFNWGFPYQAALSSETSLNMPRDTENPISVENVLSPGNICILHARFAGRVSHALGPDRSLTCGRHHDSIETLRVHLDWCRLILDVFSHSTTKCEEALHEMFRSIWLPIIYPGRSSYDELPEELFESFQAWFDFVRYLNRAYDLSISVFAEDADADNGRRCVEDLYFDVCLAEEEVEAKVILESVYDSEHIQGREGLTKLARDIRSIHGDLALMRNHSLCILDNDNMLAITNYWCQKGDEVFVFPCTDSPFVVRKAPDGDGYRLIGPAWVDRLLRVGYQKWRSEGDDLQDIVLI